MTLLLKSALMSSLSTEDITVASSAVKAINVKVFYYFGCFCLLLSYLLPDYSNGSAYPFFFCAIIFESLCGFAIELSSNLYLWKSPRCINAQRGTGFKAQARTFRMRGAVLFKRSMSFPNPFFWNELDNSVISGIKNHDDHANTNKVR